jgi:hypothetical protein
VEAAEGRAAGERVEGLMQSSEGEAGIAGEQSMHQRRPRTHLPEDNQRPFNPLLENIRSALPQLLRTNPLPKDTDQLTMGHRSPERIQHGGLAKVKRQ